MTGVQSIRCVANTRNESPGGNRPAARDVEASMTRRLATPVLIAALSLLPLSCGDGDDVRTDSTSSTTAPGTAPPATAHPTTVGPPTSSGPPAVEIVSFETSFGMCAGWCVRRIDLDTAPDVADAPTATLVASNRLEGGGEATITATLTDAGASQLATAAASLEDVTIDEVYGCPDCADGGASSLTVARGVEIVTTTYDFGGPPPELVEADAVGTSLLDALASCTSTDLVTVDEGCEPIDD